MENWTFQIDHLNGENFVPVSSDAGLEPAAASDAFVTFLNSLGREPVQEELDSHVAFGIDTTEHVWRAWAGEEAPGATSEFIRRSVTTDQILRRLQTESEEAHWFSDGEAVEISELSMNGFSMVVHHDEESRTRTRVTREHLMEQGSAGYHPNTLMFDNPAGSWVLRAKVARRAEPEAYYKTDGAV